MKQRVLSGMQPTGSLHLGNYLGAMRNWVAMQDDYECLYCIVDLHGLTVQRDPKDLAHSIRSVTAAYLACGLDPEKSAVFNQSQIPGHAELAWIFNCLTPMGWLNRMTQFKDKAGKNREKAVVGLYTYPVLQAADILIYNAHHVPVGEDQKQHIELCRDIAGAFNHRYGQDYFNLPEPQILGNATRVMSLRDGTAKMSKSDPSEYAWIGLNDSVDTIALKIRKAKTDPDALPSEVAGLDGRPEAQNLMTIYAALTDQPLESVCTEFGGTPFSDFKKKLTDVIIEKIAPINQRYDQLLNDEGYVESVLEEGRQKAQAIAEKTRNEVYDMVGLLRTC